MPQYFFRLRHGKDTLNAWDAVELPDLATVRREACLIARDFMDPPSGRLRPAWDGWWIEAQEAEGDCVLTLALEVAGAEGLLGRRASGARCAGADAGEDRVLYLTPRRHQDRSPHHREVQERALALQLLIGVVMDRHRFARNAMCHQLRSARNTMAQTRVLVAASRAQLDASMWAREGGGTVARRNALHDQLASVDWVRLDALLRGRDGGAAVPDR